MADTLTPEKETAVVNTLESNLRQPDARDTSALFQQQLGGMSHADQLQIVNHINQDKQNEGYGANQPLPELTLHDDGKITEKTAGNEFNVWQGSGGASAGADLKAPDSYYPTLELGGIQQASSQFVGDVQHDPLGAIKAAGQTGVDVLKGAADAFLVPAGHLVDQAKQGHE
jgi:hypothetical protein